jgi:hypothetical protein
MFASMFIPVLLSGCGGGGGASAPRVATPVTYQWQMVQLDSMEKNSALANGCIIYADSAAENNVISAIVATHNYNILYHNADGSIATKISSDNISNGLLTITADEVPDDGYVSLEEVDGSISASSEVYMFSVAKSLLTDLVVNVRQSQNSGNSCYKGSDYRDTTMMSDSAALFVDIDLGNSGYYQTSYDASSVSGGISMFNIPVLSPQTPEHDTLVTAFAGYDSGTGQKTDLQYYAFADSRDVYDRSSGLSSYPQVELAPANYDLNWSYNDSNVTLTESSVYALHDDLIYFWQPLYEGKNITIADTSEVSNWSGYFLGSESDYSWTFEAFIAFDSDTSSDVIPTLPALSDVSGAALARNCDVEGNIAEYCVDSGSSYNSEDFTL